MAQRFTNPRPQFLDDAPVVREGARLFFYESGSSTKLDTFTDAALTSLNLNPITLDEYGQPPAAIWLQNRDYKVVLAPPGSDDPPSSAIWTEDPVRGSDFASFSIRKISDGSPNGSVAGTAGSAGVMPTECWDYTNHTLYVCTTTGDAATAVWTAINASAATPAVPPPQGRLTMTSNTPVITTGVSGQPHLFYAHDCGNLLPIYNGSILVPTEFALQMLLTLASQHAANTIYDVFVFSNSGVLTLVTGPAWANSTPGSCSRGTGAGTTELARIKGILVNAVAMSAARNGTTTYSIGANMATFLGSIWVDGTAGQLTHHTTYGQSRKCGVWNVYNQRAIMLKGGDSTSSWTYNTNTIRASNNSSANKVSVFSGLAEQFAKLTFAQKLSLVADGSNNANSIIGIGKNSTTAMSGRRTDLKFANLASLSGFLPGYSELIDAPFLGINDYTALEQTVATGSNNTFYGAESDMLLTATWMG